MQLTSVSPIVPLNQLNIENIPLNNALDFSIPQSNQTVFATEILSMELTGSFSPQTPIVLRYRINPINPNPDPNHPPNAARMLDYVQIKTPVSPFFVLDTFEQWQQAKDANSVRPVTPKEWENYMLQVQIDPNNLYPDNQFGPPNLEVWPGTECLCPDANEPPAAGLIMAWDPSRTSSAWAWDYPSDPDLSNVTINIGVIPPPWINVVSFAMVDNNNVIRAWFWNVPVPIPSNVLTNITINTALPPGPAQAAPVATGYNSGAGFDITKVVSFIVDENSVFIGGSVPVPPPGQTIPKAWNYWRDLIVTPNPPVKPDNPLKWSQPPLQCGPSIYLGWDEPSLRELPPLLADDWLCLDDRPITDIHWWGSFLHWIDPHLPPPPLTPIGFEFGIWTDIPKDPTNFKSFSHPNELLWTYFCDFSEVKWNFVGYDKDPRSPALQTNPDLTTTDTIFAVAGDVAIVPAVHDATFQFHCDIPEPLWFFQDPNFVWGGRIYWLSISAVYPPQQTPTFNQFPWGWKTRPHNFNDDAVRIFEVTDPAGNSIWPPQIGDRWQLGQPVEFPRWISWDLAFELTTDVCRSAADVEDGFEITGEGLDEAIDEGLIR